MIFPEACQQFEQIFIKHTTFCNKTSKNYVIIIIIYTFAPPIRNYIRLKNNTKANGIPGGS